MKLVVAVVASVLLLAGCSGSTSDETAPKPSATASEPSADRAALEKQVKEQAEQARLAEQALGTVVEISISDGKVTPQGKRVEVKVGDKVTLQMTSDAAEEIHVHSDPEHSYELAPLKTVSDSFTIDRPGQVAVEAHHLGVTVVQLVVRP